jgi:large subunit ribosomal protein L21
MYAIVEIEGKQFKVRKDDLVSVPYMADKEVGAKIEIDAVLALVNDGKTTFGNPVVKGKKVVAEVTEHNRDKKVIVFKKKRRKAYRRTQGHRQWFTRVKIESIG